MLTIFLKDKVENSQFLFDYQNKKLLKSSYIKNNKKQNLICYSNKSNKFIELLKQSSNKKFIELKGFSSNQMINILKKQKFTLILAIILEKIKCQEKQPYLIIV